MTQFDYGTINATTKDGTTLASDLSSFRDALNSHHSGNSAPSYVAEGMIWIDTTTTTWSVNMRAGGVDEVLFKIDSSANKIIGHTAVPVSTAAAATVDLGAIISEFVTITGNTAITSFGTVAAGTWRWLYFTGTPTLTEGANILNLTGANVVVEAGDWALMVSMGSGVWRMANYGRKAGYPLSSLVARTDIVNAFGGGQYLATQSPSFSASYAPDLSLGQRIALGDVTATLTVGVATNCYLGEPFLLILTQDSTGSRAITMNAGYIDQPAAFVTAADKRQFLWGEISAVSGTTMTEAVITRSFIEP